jgi:CBS domain-containing protein
MKVDNVLTEDVFVVGPDDTVSEAVKKLAEKGISGAPVVNVEGELVGIITEADILNALKVKYKRLKMVYPSLSLVSVSFVETFDSKEAVEAFDDISASKVSDLMTEDVVTIEMGSELGLVVQLMMERNVNRVPVIKDGKLVGIVSRADIIKGLAGSDIVLRV